MTTKKAVKYDVQRAAGTKTPEVQQIKSKRPVYDVLNIPSMRL
jgi:hypothetical protein